MVFNKLLGVVMKNLIECLIKKYKSNGNEISNTITVMDLIVHLIKNHKINDNIAYMLWTISDVETACDNIGIELTENEKKEVIDRVNKYKNVEHGIRLRDIENYIIDIFRGQ